MQRNKKKPLMHRNKKKTLMNRNKKKQKWHKVYLSNNPKGKVKVKRRILVMMILK